ncbi:glycosyltransferase family 4 protein [candidate division WOR-3 bacterium]|nr:glycosyltransferase family 4 protein [candidate division WOR-3 bacterium]
MIKVLFTTPVLEHPAAGGPQLRIENSIKALSKVSELHIISRARLASIGGMDAQRFYESYCKKFLYVPSAKRLSNNRYMRKIQRTSRGFLSQDCKFILQYAARHSINVIWFGYGNISFDLICKIKKNRYDIQVVCDTDSVWSRFILRGLPYEESLIRKLKIYTAGKKKEREEQVLVNLADITTAVSDIDAQYYRSITNVPEKIQLFSNVLDIKEYNKKPEPPKDIKRPAIYLAGTFSPKSPMDKAAWWIIKDVLPILKKAIPNIHFYIIGRGSNHTFSNVNDPNITITGKLPSVLPYLCNVDVSIVPLRFESGTRFKILEAGACDIPVISTTLGAEGLPVTHGKDILVADSPEEFANSVIRLIQDKNLSSQLAENLRTLVRSKFSIEHLEIEAGNILEKLNCHYDKEFL